MLKIFILIIILIVIFYLLNKNIFKKPVKEHYLTYYLPFYDPSKNDLSNFYKNNDNNANYFKKKFNYDVIKFGILKDEKIFAKDLLSNYIAKSNSINAESIYYYNGIQAIDDLANNKINFSLNDFSTIMYYSDILHKNLNNIKLVTNLYNVYFYFLTKKRYKVFSLSEIPPYYVIGIIGDPDPFFFYYQKFFKDLGYSENVDYKIKIYDNLYKLLDGFLNSECHMIIVMNIFPNADISNFLDNNTNEDILFLPFDIQNETLFLKKNPIIIKETIDLNQLSTSYLPRKFGKFEYNKNRPDMKACYVQKILLTNNTTEEKYTYNFIKFYFENYKYINDNMKYKGYKIPSVNIDNNKINYLDYHKGVLDFFYDKGYITNIDNDNCKYLVGKMTCNKKNLKNNNL